MGVAASRDSHQAGLECLLNRLRRHAMKTERSPRLPGSLDELDGLRAARWIRESTRGQYDNYGPEAQREQQDRAVERWRLADTGI